MNDPYDLQRFVDAQDAGGTYEQAITELKRGRKQSHWIWFVFPQVAGLGQSPTSKRFAISSLAEAQAYLQHPVLGRRLAESAQVLLDGHSADADDIFGGLDAQKLRSSMTLFHRAALDDSVFEQVLSRFFGSKADPATDRLLGSPA